MQVSYAIGVADPVSFKIDTFGTGKLPDEVLTAMVETLVDMKPGTIINSFGLERPIFKQFAAYGHFGRNKMTLDGAEIDTPWEVLDLALTLKTLAEDYLMRKGGEDRE